jgi:hypothetical protein
MLRGALYATCLGRPGPVRAMRFGSSCAPTICSAGYGVDRHMAMPALKLDTETMTLENSIVRLESDVEHMDLSRATIKEA